MMRGISDFYTKILYIKSTTYEICIFKYTILRKKRIL